jgi:hypothetical protein
VLCADTQETISGYVKTDTEKMRVLQGNTYSISFTGSGDTDLLEMTIDEMDKALTLKNPFGAWPIEAILKDVLVDVFNKNIRPYSSFSYEERPNIPTLLIGLQFDAGVLLYKASGTKFRRLREAECVGTGVVLGKSLIGQLFNRSLTLTQTGLVAIYILNQAKRWVDGCGGKTDVLLLSDRDKKITRIPTDEVETLERHFNDFNGYIQPVLLAAADGAVSHAEYERVMHEFAGNLLGLRGKFMEMNEFFRVVYEKAGLPVPQELLEPDSTQSTSEKSAGQP